MVVIAVRNAAEKAELVISCTLLSCKLPVIDQGIVGERQQTFGEAVEGVLLLE